MLSRGCAAMAIAIAVLAPSIAHADADGTPWGVVPGLRIGAVHGSFDGTTEMPASNGGWGYTTEFHVDVLRTFGGDKRAVGLSLGYLSQTRNGEVLTVDPTTFQHSGAAATLIVSTVLKQSLSASARAGLASGDTRTGAGPIDGNLKRFGLELTYVSTFAHIIDVASHVSVEYFTAGETRHFSAVAIVVGATFAFGLF